MITLRWPSHFPVRATEWMLAFIKTAWGFVLLLPSDMFHRQTFSAMAQIAGQTTWGWIAFCAGLFHMIALFVNGTQRRSPHLRAFCSVIGVLFWFQVSLGFALSGISTAWAVYPTFVMFSVYNVMRAMQDARLSDDAFKAGSFKSGES